MKIQRTHRALALAAAIGLGVTGTAIGAVTKNYGIYFGGLGNRVTTDVNTHDFAGKDFTLSGWFMPQYPHGYRGPIVATVSRGKGFEFGQDNYRLGDGGYKDVGSPVLYLRFGSTERRYLVPDWTADEWQHFALVRKDDKVRLYVNGTLRLPFAILQPRVVGIGIAKSTGKVYTWFWDNTGVQVNRVMVGTPTDPDAHHYPYYFSTAPGRDVKSIVGMGIASNDRVYTWYADGTRSVGTSGNLDAYGAPQAYSLPPGRSAGDVVAMAIAPNDRVFTWYADGTRSMGTSTNLDAYAAPVAFTMPAERQPTDIREAAIAPNGRVRYWYRDDTVSVGTSLNTTMFEGAQDVEKTRALVALGAAVPLPADFSTNGNLVFGRTAPFARRDAGQAYGILDDVAIFTVGVGQAGVEVLASPSYQLAAGWSVYRAWTFDQYSTPPPQQLKPAYKLHERAMKVLLPNPTTKDDGAAAVFSSAVNLLYTSKSHNRALPFAASEVWVVIQGHDNPGVSHNGSAVFSFDLARVGGAADAQVVAAEGGHVVRYLNDDCDATAAVPREACYVRMRYDTPSDGRFGTYLHLNGNSVEDHNLSGPFVPMVVQDRTEWFDLNGDLAGTAVYKAENSLLGTVGDDAVHLHYGEGNGVVQQPNVFSAYCASNDQGVTWSYVAFGIPRQGQYLKRYEGTVGCY